MATATALRRQAGHDHKNRALTPIRQEFFAHIDQRLFSPGGHGWLLKCLPVELTRQLDTDAGRGRFRCIRRTEVFRAHTRGR